MHICIVVGTNTIAHSGDKSMIESSSVEDHTRQKALADCNISQQHSQRCANLVTHKLVSFYESIYRCIFSVIDGFEMSVVAFNIIIYLFILLILLFIYLFY